MSPVALRKTPREPDQRVFLHGVSWEQYEKLLEIRGDHSVPRMSYLEGELELMSPSIDHEGIKKMIARLLEAYADDMGLSLNSYGSWTVKRKRTERGAEPDECYVLGTQRPTRPDLAIEVIWTHGGLDKLEIYRGLGVSEVWLYQRGRIQVHLLRDGRYARVERSVLFPDIDLAELCRYAQEHDHAGAVRRYRAALRRRA